MKALLVMTIMTTMSFDLSASILCHTPRSNKIFEIKNTNITFFNESDTNIKRELASVPFRSKASGQGLTKIVHFENQKHTIHIGDSANFSETEDYIIISEKSGHEVIYPLTCQNK